MNCIDADNYIGLLFRNRYAVQHAAIYYDDYRNGNVKNGYISTVARIKSRKKKNKK